MFRRKLASILVFVIAVSALMQGPGVAETYASTGSFDARLGDIMDPGTNSSVPKRTISGFGDQHYGTDYAKQAILSWELAPSENDNIHKLTYPIEKNKYVELLVSKSGIGAQRSLEVHYNLYELSAGSFQKKTYAAGSNAYQVFGDGNVNRWINPGAFPKADSGAKYENYKVLSTTNAEFQITNAIDANGFSFTYDSHIMHFLWDYQNNTFYFATDKLEPNIIYDFTLEWGAASSKKYIYIADKPVFEPMTLIGGGTQGKDDVIDALIKNGQLPSESETPGVAPQALSARIKVPQAWDLDKGANKCSLVSAAGMNLNKKIELNVELKAQNGSTVQFTVDNISTKSPNVKGYSYNPPNPAAPPASIAVQGDEIIVTMFGMDDGQIYSGEVRPVSGDAEVRVRYAKLPFGGAFTLIKYIVKIIGNRTYLELWPYDVPGNYLLAGSNLSTETPDIERQDYWIVPDFELMNPQGSILFPVPVDSNGAIFRIQFVAKSDPGKKFLSQFLRAELEGGGAMLESPTEFKILDSSLTRAESYFTGKEGELTLKLRWDLGTAESIKEMIEREGWIGISYALGRALSPESSHRVDTFANVNVELDMDGENILSTFSAVVPVDKDVPITGAVTKAPSTQDGREHYYAEVTLTVPAADKSNINPSSDNPFFYPNVYFLNAKPVEFITPTETQARSMDASPFDNFTMGTIARPNVPALQNPSAGETETVNNASGEAMKVRFTYKIQMPVTSLHEYMKYYMPELDPAKAELKLNLYISQDEADISALDAQGRADAIIAKPTRDTLYFSDMLASTGTAVAMALSPAGAYADPREALRDGEIICVEDVPLSEEAVKSILASGAGVGTQSFILDGLDKNQKYYICADIVITHFDDNGEVAENEPDGEQQIRRSALSAVVGVTTKGDPEMPKPDEKVPVAPTLRIQTIDGVQSVEADNATIEWNRIDEVSGEKIEYEVLRTQSSPMPDEMLSLQEEFKTVWASLGALDKRAVLTSGESAVQLWNGSNFGSDPAGEYVYTHSLVDKLCTYTDNTLVANRIYYYYVRTVKTVNGVTSYSNWSRVTLTTKPVQRPTGLKIEPPKTNPADMNYDGKTQVMFSFSSTVVPTAQLGSEYTFFYQLKKEGASWSDPEPMDVATLQRWAEATGNNWRYYYKISGLEQGSGYQLRIFTRDSSGTDSFYSETVAFRTDRDQEDYDNKEEAETWGRYFKDELQKLLKDPFWTLYGTTNRLEVVYRPSMWDSLIVEAKDANINLYGSAADDAAYYIPVGSLMAANEANKGLRIVHENMEIIIPAKAVDAYLNTAIGDLNKKVKDKSIADYYIKINLEWRDIGMVDGADTATKRVNILFETVDSSATAIQWDKDMLALMAEAVAKKAEDAGVIEKLKDRLEAGTASEEIIKYIESVIDETAREFSSTLYAEFRDVSKQARTLLLDKQYTIIGKDTAERSVGNGYEYQGSWTPMETVPYGAGRAIYPKSAGTFVFAGRSATIPSLGGLPDAGTITSLIYKYNLEDFFGQMSTATLERNADRDMLAGTVARIAGAARGADSYDWLNQNKKLTISRRNGQSAAETQEALYMIMSLYELKTNKKVSGIQIKNYALTNNMKGLEDKYKQHVRAAFELGIYTNKSMQPAGGIKVRDVLGMLANLDKRVKL